MQSRFCVSCNGRKTQAFPLALNYHTIEVISSYSKSSIVHPSDFVSSSICLIKAFSFSPQPIDTSN